MRSPPSLAVPLLLSTDANHSYIPFLHRKSQDSTRTLATTFSLKHQTRFNENIGYCLRSYRQVITSNGVLSVRMTVRFSVGIRNPGRRSEGVLCALLVAVGVAGIHLFQVHLASLHVMVVQDLRVPSERQVSTGPLKKETTGKTYIMIFHVSTGRSASLKLQSNFSSATGSSVGS